MTGLEAVVTVVVSIIGSGFLTTLLNHFLTQSSNKKNGEKEIKQAARLLMKDRLRFLCMHYIEQGWIYEDELEDIISMHNCYHNDLNGNGFLDKQMEKVNNLEVRGIGVK